jgi:hypothetical protein
MLERMWKEVVVAKFQSIIPAIPGETEKNYEKYQSRQPVSGPNLNPGPSEYKLGVLTTRP